MNLSLLLARRIRKPDRSSFSSTVMRVGMASIAVGIATLICAFSVLYGFKDTIQAKLISLSGHLQVSKITANRSFEETPFERNSKTENIFKTLPGYRTYYPVINKAAILKSKTEIGGVMVKGLPPAYSSGLFQSNLTQGSWLALDSSRTKQLIISQLLSKKLKLSLHDKVVVYFVQNPPRARKLEVVGIYNTGIPEFDENLIISDQSLLQKLNNWGPKEAGHYEIVLNKLDEVEKSVSVLKEKLPMELEAHSVYSQYPQFFEWFHLLDRNILIVLVLIIVVAAFNMVSVLLIMIMERTPMIGILKALGMPNASIRRIFIINGVQLILRGLVIGNVLGLALCFIQWKWRMIPLDPQNYYMNYIPVKLHWPTLLALNVFVLVLVGLALWLPTQVSLRIKPVEAIKYKD